MIVRGNAGPPSPSDAFHICAIVYMVNVLTLDRHFIDMSTLRVYYTKKMTVAVVLMVFRGTIWRVIVCFTFPFIVNGQYDSNRLNYNII